MFVKRKVGPKGQIVIPKDAREFLGIKRGSNVVMEVKEGVLIVRPQKPADKAVDDYASVVKRKLAREIGIKQILEEEVEQRTVLR